MTTARCALLALALALGACGAVPEEPVQKCPEVTTEEETDGGVGGTGKKDCPKPVID